MAFLSYLFFFAHLPPHRPWWCARTSWCPRQHGTTRRWGDRSWGEPPALQLLIATARLKRSILSIFFLISNGCCEAYWANVCKLLWNPLMNCALGMLSIAPPGLFLTWSIRDELFLYRELTSCQKKRAIKHSFTKHQLELLFLRLFGEKDPRLVELDIFKFTRMNLS